MERQIALGAIEQTDFDIRKSSSELTQIYGLGELSVPKVEIRNSQTGKCNLQFLAFAGYGICEFRISIFDFRMHGGQVGRVAGLYSSEALGRTAEQDLSKLEGRSLKAAVWKIFVFHLFRVALFFGAAYSNYNKSPGTAWLLGIILVYSFLDPQFFMKPNLMTAYLAFTVIFYYCRWVMEWGAQATTIYSEDAPNWVRVIKDIVWVGVFAAFGFRALTRPKFSRNMPFWFTPRGMIMVLLTVIFLALPFLSFFYARGDLFECRPHRF